MKLCIICDDDFRIEYAFECVCSVCIIDSKVNSSYFAFSFESLFYKEDLPSDFHEVYLMSFLQKDEVNVSA